MDLNIYSKVFKEYDREVARDNRQSSDVQVDRGLVREDLLFNA